MWDWSKSPCLILALELTKCFRIYPFHSHDLNINSPPSLSYITYSVSFENLVLNQTISPSWFFLILITCLLNNVMILQGEITYWSLLGVKGIFTIIYSSLLGFIWNQHNNQLPVGLSTQLVEHCNGIAEVMGSNPVHVWIFFKPYFHYCSSIVHYCKDRFHIHFFIRSSHGWFSYIFTVIQKLTLKTKMINNSQRV